MSEQGIKIDDNQSEAIPATVLCVDDEANILSSLRRLLRSQGYKLLFAENGIEGLAIMEKEHVDLVISDMRMPEMDGAKFLTKVAECWPDTMRILLTGYSDITATIDAINKGQIFKYIAKPWEDNDILLSIQRALQLKNLESERRRLEKLTQKQNEELQGLNKNLEHLVKQRTSEIEQTLGMYEAVNEELKSSYTTTIEIFSNIIAMRRGFSGGEMREIAELARLMAIEMGVDEVNAQNIYYAALLRDIGQIGLSDSLFDRPFSTLSSAEKGKILKHPVIGQGVLMALEPLQEVSVIIRCQNESFDGRGYPDHLTGKNIPLGSRILLILNDFYGLQNGTLTERTFTATEARDVISKDGGKRYDPEVVEVFLKTTHIFNENIQSEDVVLVKSNGLCHGMVLARDIISISGVLLLSKGHVVTDELIDRVDNFERSIDEDLDIFVINDGTL